MTDWLPAITSTAILGGALWLARHLIATRLSASVKHEFDSKLEQLRSEVRHREELLKANLRAQEVELAAIRDGALSAMASRQVAVNKRRIEAVDQLWSAVTMLRPAKTAVMFMSLWRFDTAAARAQMDPKLRRFFQELGGPTDFTKLDQSSAAKARPFISTPAWASYTALLSVLGFALLRLQILRSGADPKGIVPDSAGINKVLKAALPHQASFIDKYGQLVHTFLVEEIENKLLRELQDMLTGRDADKEALANAAEILTQANELQKETAAKRMDLAEGAGE